MACGCLTICSQSVDLAAATDMIICLLQGKDTLETGDALDTLDTVDTVDTVGTVDMWTVLTLRMFCDVHDNALEAN